MNDLGTALRELARTAEAPNPPDTADLWTRGRARVRRTRIAVAGGIAVLAVVVASISFAGVPTLEVTPSGSPHRPAVPMNVWPAKSWYAGTAEAGPPGDVAVLGGVQRDGGNGLFVVSASDGAYRLLDLPDLADPRSGDELAALAPDGKHIAYWLTGATTGVAFSDGHSDLPVGVGVYNTWDGSIQRYLPVTEHGISADSLQWLDPDTLMMTYGQRTSASSATGIRTFAWQPGVSEPKAIAKQEPLIFQDVMVNRYGGVLAKSADGSLNLNGRGPRFGDLQSTGEVNSDDLVSTSFLIDGEFDAAARSAEYVVAHKHLDDGTDQFVVNGDVLPGLDNATFEGWLAEDRVLFLGDPTGGDSYASLYAVDLKTLSRTRLGTADGAERSPGLSFATDLLGAPLVDGDHPPRVDPRWWKFAGGAGLVLALGLVAAVLRRRRG